MDDCASAGDEGRSAGAMIDGLQTQERIDSRVEKVCRLRDMV